MRQEKAIVTATLALNGATIDYDQRGGDGPPLLLLPGGSGHAGVLDRLATHLAGHYRVVSMCSRVASAATPDSVASAATPDSVNEEQHPTVHAEDTRALIAKLFDEPPTVIAFSSGA
ncbi:MAG TPA: hypothetical protein VGB74_17790, partial [Actinoplanes sp.]